MVRIQLMVQRCMGAAFCSSLRTGKNAMIVSVVRADAIGPDVMTEAGFVAAVRAIHPALQRYARSLTRDDSRGEDLVQDALTRAWRARAQFEPHSNFKAWLFRILRNSFLSGARRAWRTVSWDATVDDRRLISAADQETGLHFDNLEQALDCLPAGHADALLAVTREGLSYEEAADLLSIPVGTLRSRVHRARLVVMEYFGNAKAVLHENPPATLLDDRAEHKDVYAEWKRSGSRIIG